MPPSATGNATAPPFPEAIPRELPPEAVLVIKWLAITAVAAAVIYILARALARLRGRREEEEIEEIHESLFTWDRLGKDLRDLLSGMAKRFQRKPLEAPAIDYRADETQRLDIREIYRRLLWEAARAGFSRFCQETPAEYSRRVGYRLHGGRELLAQLTEIYMGVRYGEIPISEKELDSANSAWRQLRDLLRGLVAR